VRTKVDRIQTAHGEDLAALESELEVGWNDLRECANTVRRALFDTNTPGHGDQGASIA
jgi:hypothetical protein